jgi:hypothetical protein
MFVEQALVAAGNWVQEALLNRSRQRRRLRRGLEDWGHMLQHGLNADLSEAWLDLVKAREWLWRNESPEDMQVGSSGVAGDGCLQLEACIRW